jgi:hypothetical protein
MKRLVTLLLICLFASSTPSVEAATIYWVGTTGNYSDGLNWNTQPDGSGTSGVPVNTDDVVISKNATINIDGTYQPSSLWITNNAVVNFTNSVASRNYSIGGSLTVSPAFKIEAGATLNIQGTAAVVLDVITGNAAQIYGTLDFTGTSSRMVYLGGITQVMNGGKLRYGPGSSNGTGSTTTFFMLNGSTYEVYKNGGSFPTGTYDAGSTILNTGAVANAATFNMNSSVGSYGIYEFNSPGYTNTTNGVNQNITVSGFKLTNNGTGRWVFSTSNSTAYTLTVNGQFYMDAGTSLDINRAASGSQATTILANGDFYSFGSITETGNNIGSVIEFGGSTPANLGISPTALSNNVSLRINRTAPLLSDDVYMPNSPDARLYLVNGNLDVLTNDALVYLNNPLPDALVGGTVNSHIIGRLARKSGGTGTYDFPVSNNATQLAMASITPASATGSLWDVTFFAPNPDASNGLTPGTIDMVTPYYWRIDNSNPEVIGATTIALHYSELSSPMVLNPAQLKVLNWNGTAWESLGGAVAGGAASNTLGSNGAPAPVDSVTTFSLLSKFALGGVVGTLPLSLEYFRGAKSGAANLLRWKINLPENETIAIYLERSADARRFSTLNQWTADATACRLPFEYADQLPIKGTGYYRLRIVDADGRTTYSPVIALLQGETDQLALQLYPNPVYKGSHATLTIGTQQAKTCSIALIDVTGKQLWATKQALQPGSNPVNLPAQLLPTGTYRVVVQPENGTKQTIAFIIQ